jgi:nucleoside-diphosphate-sugar epimerase
MKVLILGGTGYLGKRMTRLLATRGDEVTVVSRSSEVAGAPQRVRYTHVDRRDGDAFVAAFRSASFDAVIDNIAYNADDIDLIVRAFGGRIRQYLFTSTMAVYQYGERLKPFAEDEADLTYVEPPDVPPTLAFHTTHGHAYGIGKRQAEHKLLTVDASVLAGTILRAPIVVGPDDRTRRVWWFVQRILDGGPILLPDWGPGHIFQLVYADDLAAAFVAALGNPAAYRRAYNVAQPELFTAQTWVNALAGALGRKAECVHIPETLVAPAGLEGYQIPIVHRPFGHFIMDICRARTELPFVPTPGPAWIADTARGCAEYPPSEDSLGYARRSEEIALARRIAAFDQERWQRLIG